MYILKEQLTEHIAVYLVRMVFMELTDGGAPAFVFLANPRVEQSLRMSTDQFYSHSYAS